jgi:hypothetical protein
MPYYRSFVSLRFNIVAIANLGPVAGGPVLEKVGAPLPVHEQLKFFLQHLAVPYTVHHLHCLQQLNATLPPPAEAAPHHDLGGGGGGA